MPFLATWDIFSHLSAYVIEMDVAHAGSFSNVSNVSTIATQFFVSTLNR